MNLLDRIDDALDRRKLDEDLFEEAACFFLTAVYPGLSPIRGGHDFGRDADIHGTSPPPSLICTSGRDVKRNIDTSLRSARATDRDVREVVVAASTNLTGLMRRKLEQHVAATYGAEVIGVHDRSWLRIQLYYDAEWRERLIQVHGTPSALLQVSPSLARQPGSMVPLVARAEEVAQVESLTGDAVLVGAPGIGKTRLLAEARGTLFLQQADAAKVADELRTAGSVLVVVDDAHRRLDDLRLLHRIRLEERLTYRILAVTWPDTLAVVEDELNADRIILEPLTRSQIDAVLHSQGITSHYLRAEILNQAQGRPGWALVLSELATRGEAAQLMRGDGLLTQLERYARQIDRPGALDVMACIALLDGITAEEVPALGSQLQRTEVEINELLLTLADNGLAERRFGEWHVEPAAIRRALVGTWFCGARARRSPGPLLKAFPDREYSVLSALIRSGRYGYEAAAREAKQRVPAAVQHGMTDLLPMYALLDTEAAKWVVPQLLATGMRSDSTYTRDRISRALEAVVVHFRLSAAIMALLDLAVGDGRPLHSTPDHPLRLLQELAGKVLPDGVMLEGMRHAIITASCEWLQSRAEDDARADVFGRVVAAALSPGVGGAWPDVVDPMTIQLRRGTDTDHHLRELVETGWPPVARLLPSLPDAAVVPLLQTMAQEWLIVASGHSRGAGVTVPRSTQQAAREGARVLMSDLRVRASTSLGLSVLYNGLARRRRIGTLIRVSQDFAFVAQDFLGWYRSQDALSSRTLKMAAKWAKDGPKVTLKRLIAWRGQLALVGPYHEMLGRLLYALAETVSSPTEWAVEVVALGYCPEGHAFFSAAAQREPEWTGEWLDGANEGPCGLVAQAAALTHLHNLPAEAQAVALRIVGSGGSDSAATLARLPGLPDAAFGVMLRHPSAVVRHRACLARSPAIDDERLPPVPADLRNEWDAVLLEGASAIERYSGEEEYRLGRVLEWLAENEPETARQWFANRMGQVGKSTYTRAMPRFSRQILPSLSSDLREKLYRDYATQHGAGELFADLVGTDFDWMDRLMANGTVDAGRACRVLYRMPLGTAFERAAVPTLRRGASVDSVLTAMDRGYAGSESAMYERLREYCEGLARSSVAELAELGRAGQERFSKLKSDAQQRERSEQVQGLPDNDD